VSKQDAGKTAEPTFIADAMLGRLATWLRILGYDTDYEAHVADDELARRAREARRILLTRDRMLPRQQHVTDYLLLDSDRPLEQLRQVIRCYRLDWRSRLFTRCARCNAALEQIDKRKITGRVPTRVLSERDRFARCMGCDRIYWSGSHVERMRRQLARMMGF
jgi:uncharacterized protein with PIN domain